VSEMTHRCDRCGREIYRAGKRYEVGPALLCGKCFDELVVRHYGFHGDP